MKPPAEQVIREMQAAASLDEAAELLRRSGVQEEVKRWLETRDVAFTARSMNPLPAPPGPPS